MFLNITNTTQNSINKKVIVTFVDDLLLKYKIKGIIELNIFIVGARKMQNINLRHRNINKTTDVLSFGQPKISTLPKDLRKIKQLGDIIICYPKVISQAKNNNINTQEELLFLIEHGFKHLIGIHHKE